MGIIVDFSYQTSLGAIKNKKFTNLLKDKEEYIFVITHILNKMIPEISSKNINEIKNNKSYHIHIIKDKKLDDAYNILREIVKNVYDYDDNGAEQWMDNQGIYMQQLWQIACPDSHGIRMIGIIEEDAPIFHVLFIDYHHQLFPDEKNNQSNIGKNTFAILDYVKERK